MSGDRQTVAVDIWNVGQGDASSIRLPSGELILIDVGPGNSTVSQWLRSGHRGQIRDIILTHNDTDHAGALPEMVADPAVEIKRVLMLEDRNRSDNRQKALFRTVIDYSRRRHFEVGRLECPSCGPLVLWQDSRLGVALRLRHPAFCDNVQCRSPNDASAILTLELNSRILLLWPGDARLARVSAVAGSKVQWLFGPHHGAPQDKMSRPAMRAAIGALAPMECLVSVGTGNRYSHPNRNYIRDLVCNGCHVSCTQMTLHCDRERVNKGHHVMNTSGYFGLPAPANGVFCRGHVRVVVSSEGLGLDCYHEEHRRRLAEDVAKRRRILCMRPANE